MFRLKKSVPAGTQTLLHLSLGGIMASFFFVQPVSSAQMYAQMSGQSGSGQPRSSSAVLLVSVVRHDGSPIGEGAEVTLSLGGESGNTQMAGSQGTARFTGLGQGFYTIHVHEIGYNDAYSTVDVGTADGNFTATVVLQTDDPILMGMLLAPKAKSELDKGVDEMRLRHYDEARKHLDAAYTLAPGNPEVNDRLGELFLVTKDLDNARKTLENALSLDPQSESVLLDLADLRIVQNDYSGAEKLLTKAVSLYPRSWLAHWMLGIVYFHANENEKARDEASVAIKSGKGAANDAEFVLGEALAKLGRNDDAIRALQLFVKGSPTNSDVPAANKLIARLQTTQAPAPGACP